MCPFLVADLTRASHRVCTADGDSSHPSFLTGACTKRRISLHDHITYVAGCLLDELKDTVEAVGVAQGGGRIAGTHGSAYPGRTDTVQFVASTRDPGSPHCTPKQKTFRFCEPGDRKEAEDKNTEGP